MASNLQGFLNKFNDSSGFYASTIDTMSTFDVVFSFYPLLGGSSSKKKTSATINKYINNSLDNLTGGLFSSSQAQKVDVLKEIQKFKKDKTQVGKTTFLDPVSRANRFITDESVKDSGAKIQKPQLELDLSYYVQNMVIPQFTTNNESNVQTMIGEFPINGTFVKPSSMNFQMNVLNTKAPIMERIFYPWMREVTLPFWSYDTQPYTTANVSVKFGKHADLTYIFIGARPQNIGTWQPSNNLTDPIRQVSFVFDYMFVTSENDVIQTTNGKTKDLLNSAVGGAKNLIGL